MEIKSFASGSKGNCYSVSDGKTKILIEAGIAITEIKKSTGFKLSEYSACLISHEHRDHSRSIADILKVGIDVYAPNSCQRLVEAPQHHFYPIDTLCVKDGQLASPLIVGSMKIYPFDVEHDVPNLGFYIHSTATGENLLYFTDCYYIRYRFPDIHYIMGECNYDPQAVNWNIENGRIPIQLKKRLVQSHMSIDNFIDLLKANDLSKIKQIFLLHLSDSNSRADDFKEAVQKIVGCEVYVC